MDASSIVSYRNDYAAQLATALRSVSDAALEQACIEIEKAANGGARIYVAGNGGSAAIADHLCCDLTKGTHAIGHPVIRTHSLVSNVALYSAIANDYGFEKVFATQLDFFGERGDVLIAISSSGNSANIVNAAAAAQAAGVFVVGMSGFSGGRLAEMADAAIHVAADNYGIVEDAHQAVMHIIAQFIAARRDANAV
ncbi:MAG: SIS domain-containing protein [Proteobacteria bacterium]|nr:SIS domain-containing protein [Pseudomonadota bacterium]